MIRLDDVSYSYGAGAGGRPALERVNLELSEGEIVVVVGANGSGKSTLARLANGLLVPSSGSVSVDGIATTDGPRVREIRTRVGIVFQRPDDQIVTTSVEDDVAFGPENLGLPRDEIRRRVDAALEAAGLAGLEQREPHLLSGGQKQRLALAGALAMQPRYLVLDEPSSMIDPQGRSEILRIVSELRDSGHGILLVTHDLSDALIADRLIVLERGRVAYSGSLEQAAESVDLERVGIGMPPISTLAGRLASFCEGCGIGMGSDELIEALCR